MDCQASVPRDVFPPTPPGPEGSNGNGLLRVQWVPGAWLFFLTPVLSIPYQLAGRNAACRVSFTPISTPPIPDLTPTIGQPRPRCRTIKDSYFFHVETCRVKPSARAKIT